MCSSSRRAPRPILQDLPWFVKDRIVRSLGTKANLDLRGLARGFKDSVDRAPKFFEELSIQMNSNSFAVGITLKTDNSHQRKVVVKPHKSGFRLSNNKENWRGLAQSKPHVEGVADTVIKTLGQPQVKFGKLVIDFSNKSTHSMSEGAIRKFSDRKTEILKLLAKKLANKKRKVSVETLELKLSNGTEDDVMGIMESLKPGTLRTIRLDMGAGAELSLKNVVELEQWKQAKILKTEGFSMDSTPFLNWKHFECTVVRISNLGLELFEVMKSHYMAHSNLTYAWIQRNDDDGMLEEYCREAAAAQDADGNEDFTPSKTIMLVKPGNLWFQQREG